MLVAHVQTFCCVNGPLGPSGHWLICFTRDQPVQVNYRPPSKLMLCYHFCPNEMTVHYYRYLRCWLASVQSIWSRSFQFAQMGDCNFNTRAEVGDGEDINNNSSLLDYCSLVPAIWAGYKLRNSS